VFCWVFIEIELDLFVDYKTSFAFVLATDAVKSSKHYYAIFISTRFMWTPYKGRAKTMIYTNTHKRLLTKTIINHMFSVAHKLAARGAQTWGATTWGRSNRIPYLHHAKNIKTIFFSFQSDSRIIMKLFQISAHFFTLRSQKTTYQSHFRVLRE